MSLSRFERALLAAGSNDVPSPERRDAARAVVVAAAAGAATTAAVTTKAATISKAFVLWRVVFFAAIGGGVAVALTSSRGDVASAVTVVPAPRASENAPIAALATPAVDHDEGGAARLGREGLGRAPRVAVSRAAAPVPSPVAPWEDPLAVEARLLEAARSCLARGDHVCAGVKVGEHRARFPNGVLEEEATVLAIEIAVAAGDPSRARSLARDLLQRKPHGVWSSKVRRLAASE